MPVAAAHLVLQDPTELAALAAVVMVALQVEQEEQILAAAAVAEMQLEAQVVLEL
jgi:hypothetical protein